jgi:PAS domain S-box-containing protein
VEDKPAVAEMLRALLESEGYAVEVASTGVAGLARVQTGELDLVLLDVMLPDLDGLELCRRVRTREQSVYLPIVMCTAYATEASRLEGFAAGADDFITKPFNPDELLARVRTWTHTRQRLKVLHARVQQQQAALAQQAALLELAPDGIYVRDLAGSILYWSAGAETLYGWSKAEVDGRNVHELLQTHSVRSLAEIEAEVLRTGAWVGDLVQARRHSVPVVVASRWALQSDEAGRPVAILELNTDITLREALREAERKHAQASLEGIRLVGREVAHRLNNALVPAVGLLDLLQVRSDTPLDLRSLAEQAAAGLAEAVDDIVKLQHVVRVATWDTPTGPALDLDRAVQAEPRFESTREFPSAI